MRYPVIMRRTETGYSVEVPDLPICVTTGKTFEEAVANIREAIELHLEGLAEDGESAPAPMRTLTLGIEDLDAVITYVEAGMRMAA